MPTFTYKAIEAGGKTVKGRLEGESQQAVLTKLRERNVQVVDVTESKSGAVLALLKMNRVGRVKLAALVVFSRQFATMIDAGINVLKCLDILENQTKDPVLKTVICDCRRDVVGGSSLTEAVNKHPRVFSKLYVSMIKAAEIGGILDQILDRLATFLEREQEIIGKIKGAMVYPCVVLVFAICMVFAMMIFVLPTFKDIFADFGGELPAITSMMFSISTFMRTFWYIVLAMPVVFVSGLKYYNTTDSGRWNIDKFKLKIPVVGELIQKMAISRFARTLGTLVNSGVPMLRALEIVAETAGNVIIAKAVTDARNCVREGQKISAPLEASGMFPPMVTQMIDVGEETGRMSDMLIKVANFYDQEVEIAVKALTSLIEPALIVFLGGIVGFIVASIMVPMFTMINEINK
jgi:type IV pilus assembly protein PilC